MKATATCDVRREQPYEAGTEERRAGDRSPHRDAFAVADRWRDLSTSGSDGPQDHALSW